MRYTDSLLQRSIRGSDNHAELESDRRPANKADCAALIPQAAAQAAFRTVRRSSAGLLPTCNASVRAVRPANIGRFRFPTSCRGAGSATPTNRDRAGLIGLDRSIWHKVGRLRPSSQALPRLRRRTARLRCSMSCIPFGRCRGWSRGRRCFRMVSAQPPRCGSM